MTAEQFIKDYTNHCSNELADGGFNEWLTPEQALRAVEIAKDAFIEKALKFLDENFFFNNFHHGIESGIFDSKEEMFEDFKNYIKIF